MNFDDLLVAVESLEAVSGVTLLNVYDLPDELAYILTEVMRGRMLSVAEFADVLAVAPEKAESLGDLLVAKGFLQLQERPAPDIDKPLKVYRVQFERTRRHNLSSKVWDNLDLDS